MNRIRSEEVVAALRKKTEGLKKSLEEATRTADETISGLKKELDVTKNELLEKTKGSRFTFEF
jgi:hypothetical protein